MRPSPLVCALAFWLTTVCAFNIENRSPITKSIDQKDAYFGFSVALHQETAEPNSKKWMLVGAPLGDNLQPNVTNSGALYKCPITPLEWDCTQIVTDGQRVDGDAIEQNSLNPPGPDEKKDEQWLGVTVKSQGPGGKVVVCAHRYIRLDQFKQQKYEYGLGLCYVLHHNLTLAEDLQPCKGKPVTRLHQQYGMCQAGTSMDILDNGMVLIGSPGPYTWRGTVFAKSVEGDYIERDQETYMSPLDDNDQILDKYSYLGMSVAGCNFNKEGRSIYVAGAPRSNHTGQVFLLNKTANTEIERLFVLPGFQFGASFGYTVLTTDINNDGYDDLLVAAPFYYDATSGGIVYVYLNVSACVSGHVEACEPNFSLKGRRFSRFGLAMTALGDINKDSYNDVAIGAPFEKVDEKTTGKVYIYLGSKDGSLTESQYLSKSRANTFGYSLSGNLDVDGNNYPDLLVGAYESDTVFLYKSRAIIDIYIEIKDKNMKNLNGSKPGCSKDPYSNHTCFSFDACVQVTQQLPVELKCSFGGNTTRAGQRIFWTESGVEQHNVKRDITLTTKKPLCITETVYISNTIHDVMNPIDMKMNCSLSSQSPHTPILNKTSVEYFEATFQKNCGSDDKCTSHLELTMEPVGFTKNRTLNGIVYTSPKNLNDDELQLSVTVRNTKESAYEAKLFIEHPQSLSYIALAQSGSYLHCVTVNETLVSCDLGNPMKKKVSMVLRFEIRRTNNQGDIRIHSFVNTTSSDNYKNTTVDFTIDFEKMAKFTLSTKRTTNLYFGNQVLGESAVKTIDSIGPKVVHQYTLENSGKWSMDDFQIKILWPIKVYSPHEQGGKWLLYLEKVPVVDGSIRERGCTVDPQWVNPLGLAINDNNEPENLIDLAPNRYRRSADRLKRDVDAKIPPKKIVKADKKYKIVEFNCEDPTALCVEIVCSINELPPNSIIHISVRSRLWNSTLAEDYQEIDWVSIASSASVQVAPNIKLDPETTDRIKTETIVYPTGQQGITYWWIILAVICGILVLLVVVLCLYKCGFFKRNRVSDKTLTGNLISKDESKELLNS